MSIINNLLNFIKSKIFFILSLILFGSSLNHLLGLNQTEPQTIDPVPELKQAEQLADVYSNQVINSELIFIGGYQRSGTTLMRAILDVHPSISCGPETKIIPTLLAVIAKHLNDTHFKQTFANASFKTMSIHSSTALFIYHILENHILNTKHLCEKDPNILSFMEYLHNLFPKAKFVYMVRDGRDAAFSLMNRFQLKEFEFFDYRPYLLNWNVYNKDVFGQCQRVGHKYCKIVRYEDLVLRPKDVVRNVTEFLNVSWTEDFLRHDKYVGSKIAISKTEWSSDQIKKPIYKHSIDAWMGRIKNYDVRVVRKIGSMLSVFGYDVEKQSFNF